MSKGLFIKPVMVKLSLLVSQHVYHTDGAIVIKIPITLAKPRGMEQHSLQITYFGKTEGQHFEIYSYSFSVQHLPKNIQEMWNLDPDYTAMTGLRTMGVNL